MAEAEAHGAPDTGFGAIAQLGERLLCKQDVVGSIPSGSTTSLPVCRKAKASIRWIDARREGHER